MRGDDEASSRLIRHSAWCDPTVTRPVFDFWSPRFERIVCFFSRNSPNNFLHDPFWNPKFVREEGVVSWRNWLVLWNGVSFSPSGPDNFHLVPPWPLFLKWIFSRKEWVISWRLFNSSKWCLFRRWWALARGRFRSPQLQLQLQLRRLHTTSTNASDTCRTSSTHQASTNSLLGSLKLVRGGFTWNPLPRCPARRRSDSVTFPAVTIVSSGPVLVRTILRLLASISIRSDVSFSPWDGRACL
jgi:hypothetical protein